MCVCVAYGPLIQDEPTQQNHGEGWGPTRRPGQTSIISAVFALFPPHD